MASGIPVNDQCVATFQELKLGRKHKYILFSVNELRTEINVIKTSSSDNYEEFIADLPEEDCRYAVYDFEFVKPGGGKRNKLCFISWSPDTARIKSKMIYAASKEAIRKPLVGVAAEIQATSYDEISYETILDKVGGGA